MFELYRKEEPVLTVADVGKTVVRVEFAWLGYNNESGKAMQDFTFTGYLLEYGWDGVKHASIVDSDRMADEFISGKDPIDMGDCHHVPRMWVLYYEKLPREKHEMSTYRRVDK